MSAGLLRVDVVIAAPAQVVWDAVTDWSGQSDWMLATRVGPASTDSSGGFGVGSELAAWTGFWRLGLHDSMTITTWEPPKRVVVEHTGNLIRGLGIFEVFTLPGGGSRLAWTEDLELPLGSAGRLSWRFVRPLVAVGLRRSLAQLRRSLETTQS